jgi:hypothetical protein
MINEYFCNANKRPALCRLETNLCCLVCNYSDDCRKQSIDAGLKVLPCKDDSEIESEKCDFLL